jgi:hypothetical protein
LRDEEEEEEEGEGEERWGGVKHLNFICSFLLYYLFSL